MRDERGRVDDRLELDLVLPALAAAGEHRPLLVAVGIADRDPQQEAVELRLGQRVRALVLDRVLRREHEERPLERGASRPSIVTCRSCIASSSAACVFGGARLISSARRRFAKIGPGRELEVGRALVVDRRAGDVGRHQVGRELDAREAHRRDLRERARDQRLGEAGEVLDQHVAVGEQAEQHELERVALADDRLLDLVEDPVGERAHLVQRRARTSQSAPARRPARPARAPTRCGSSRSCGGSRSGRISCHVQRARRSARARSGWLSRSMPRAAREPRRDDVAHERAEPVVEVELVRVAAGEAADEALELQQARRSGSSRRGISRLEARRRRPRRADARADADRGDQHQEQHVRVERDPARGAGERDRERDRDDRERGPSARPGGGSARHVGASGQLVAQRRRARRAPRPSSRGRSRAG